jgi:hypothetical protein
MRTNLKSAVKDHTRAIFEAKNNNNYTWDHIFPKKAFDYLNTIVILNRIYGITVVSNKDIYIINIATGVASKSIFPQGLSSEDLEEIYDLPLLYLK